MRMTGVFLSCLLAGGMAIAQSSSGGTVNQMSVDPEQNQRRTDNMGTTTGQSNSTTRGAAPVGNPSNSQIDGQPSNEGAKGAKSAKGNKAPGGSPAANQNSASTNSTGGMRRTEGNDSAAGGQQSAHQKPTKSKSTKSNSQTSTPLPK